MLIQFFPLPPSLPSLPSLSPLPPLSLSRNSFTPNSRESYLEGVAARQLHKVVEDQGPGAVLQLLTVVGAAQLPHADAVLLGQVVHQELLAARDHALDLQRGGGPQKALGVLRADHIPVVEVWLINQPIDLSICQSSGPFARSYHPNLPIRQLPQPASQPPDRLVGLAVKASASRAEDPGFESRLRRDFSGVGAYQWL